MVVILSKDDCGLPRIDQDFNTCGSTCLVIKSFTASSTMDVVSCSSFLPLMLVALALPLALNPLVLPSRGTPPMKTFTSMVVGMSVLSTLSDSTAAVRSQPSLQLSSNDNPLVLSTCVWTVFLICLKTAGFKALSKMSLTSHLRATHFGLAIGIPLTGLEERDG